MTRNPKRNKKKELVLIWKPVTGVGLVFEAASNKVDAVKLEGPGRQRDEIHIIHDWLLEMKGGDQRPVWRWLNLLYDG